MNCCEKKEGQKFSWWWCLGLVPIGLMIVWGLKIPLGSVLPWGVFLLCPLMHVFMMRGHGEHEGHDHEECKHHHSDEEEKK